MIKQRNYPYYRLSTFYLFFFAALGIFVPYWSLYLESLSFNPAQIGELTAIALGSKIIAPYLWGWIADHKGKRIQVIRLTALLSSVFFCGIFFDSSYVWIAIVTTLFGFFWNACLPLFEGLALNHLGSKATEYSQIRIWGSIGFILSVVTLPLGFDYLGYSLIPYALLLLLFLMGLSSFLVGEKAYTIKPEPTQNIWQVIKQPVVFVFLLVCSLQVASHGAYYTFYSIYLRDNGYSPLFTGWMWALGVIAEVILFVFMHRLLNRFSAGFLLAIAFLLTTFRWILLAYFVDFLPLLLGAQLLHAVSFGLYHAAAIHLVHDLFPGRLQSRGQALYAGLSFGLGGAFGNLFSGYSWDTIGPMYTYLLSGLMSLLACIFTWWYIARNEKTVSA